MSSNSKHISVSIDRPADEVYDYTSNLASWPEWAAGVAESLAEVDGRWVADSPMGRVTIDFVERNPYGVLDHDVTLPSGETVYNPMRVIADEAGCEVVFTVRQREGMSDAEFARDAAAVTADLTALKQVMEGGGRR